MKKLLQHSDIVAPVTASLGIIFLLLVINPIINISLGYFGGIIIKWMFGSMISEALNTLFGTTRFSPDHIPVLAALIAWVGSFLRAYQKTQKAE